MRLSLLDRSRTRAGWPDSAAIPHAVERAVHAERVGYHRFWVAEHHGVPGVASGAPAVLLAAIGARTDAIRLGSGGVMLPNHQPLVVAEQFLMLDALHPGRIDLGIGRSPGFTAPVRRALRHADRPESFAPDVAELRAYLDSTSAVTARPRPERPIPMYLLATGRGVEVAAELGLPVVLGGPMVHRDEVNDRVTDYRRGFVPYRGSRPHVIVSLDLLVADTDAEARELALPEVWAMVRSRRTGAFEALESPARIRGLSWTSQETARVERALAATVTGAPATVRRQLEQLVERTGADDVLASGSTYDRGALVASDRAVAAMLA